MQYSNTKALAYSFTLWVDNILVHDSLNDEAAPISTVLKPVLKSKPGPRPPARNKPAQFSSQNQSVRQYQMLNPAVQWWIIIQSPSLSTD